MLEEIQAVQKRRCWEEPAADAIDTCQETINKPDFTSIGSVTKNGGASAFQDQLKSKLEARKRSLEAAEQMDASDSQSSTNNIANVSDIQSTAQTSGYKGELIKHPYLLCKFYRYFSSKTNPTSSRICDVSALTVSLLQFITTP